MAERSKERQTQAIAPRRPSDLALRWEREVDRMMDDFFGRRMRPWWPERWARSEDVNFESPVVDLYEDKDDIVVKAELPGIDKDNVQVNLTDHTLTIKGEKKQDEEVKEQNFYCCERSYGTLVRRLELPQDVQAEKIKAVFKNGVLEVRMPKTAESKPKGISINVA
jgi:HSP20 family protein